LPPPTLQPINYGSSNLLIPILIVKTVIGIPTCPTTLNHIGGLHNNPFYSDWKTSNKILSSGTWGAPVLKLLVPFHKTVICSRVTFKVKDTNQLDYSRTCIDGSCMKDNIDYTSSYCSIGSIDIIGLIVAIAASQKLKLNVLDISNVLYILALYLTLMITHTSLYLPFT
jgi:hypothetical protein